MATRVAIIGGGISGLAAAWAVANAGGQPTLFEASGRVGGVLETVHAGNYLVERSADNFATLIPDALELSRACGLTGELISPNVEGRQAFVLNRGRVLPIPAGFSLMQPTRVASILATKTLSARAKLRMLAEFWVAARTSDGDESLESFVTRRLGRETFENLVEPIVSGIFTADPSTLSMAATMPQFVAMERQHGGLIRGHLAARRKDAAAAARRASGARYDQFMAPRAGMNAWLAGIAAKLPSDCIRLNTPVHRMRTVPIAQDDPQESLDSAAAQSTPQPRFKIETSHGDQHEFEAIISALPAAASAQLISECNPAAAATLSGIPYASSAVVAMVVNKADLRGRIDGFGLIVPRKEQRQSLAISYTSNKYPGRTPDHEILLRVFLGGALRPEVVDLPDAQLLQLADRELRDLLGWQARQANWQAVIRWIQAMPQYLVGHMQRIATLHEQLAKTPGLQVCGAAYEGVGIPQCIRSARRAAQQLMG